MTHEYSQETKFQSDTYRTHSNWKYKYVIGDQRNTVTIRKQHNAFPLKQFIVTGLNSI